MKMTLRSRISSIAQFVGRKTVLLILGGLGAGLLFALVEGLLAQKIQLLLSVNLGLAESTIIPVVLLVIVRAFVQAIQTNLEGKQLEVFKAEQRIRICEDAFVHSMIGPSEVSTRFNETVNYAAQFINYVQRTAYTGVVSAGILGLMFYRESRLAIWALIALVLTAPVILLANRAIGRAGAGLSEGYTKISARLLSGIRNILFLRIIGMASHESAATSKQIEDVYSQFRKFFNINSVFLILPQLAGALIIGFLWTLGLTRYGLTPAELIAFIYLVLRLSQNAAQTAHTLSSSIFYRSAFLTLLRSENKNKKDLRITVSQEDLGFTPITGWKSEGCSLQFDPPFGTQIRFPNFKIPVNALTVITGRSGSGKSTLISLLIGELAPDSGSLEINGLQATVLKDWIRRQVAYVGPECFLVQGTIQTNILYGNRKAQTWSPLEKQNQILRALELASCQFVNDLSKGLDHTITENGEGLSMGQKQRLALARALLNEPKILILDEASANLDASTEHDIIETVRGLTQKMTIIAISHRDTWLDVCDHHIHLEAK